MNMNQIINMVLRIIVRKAINSGINAGIGAFSKKGGQGQEPAKSGRGNTSQRQVQDSAAQAQKMARMTRRMTRF